MTNSFSNRIVGYLLTPVAVLTLYLPAGAQPGSYSYTKLATLGDTAPQGAFHINDFETGAINNRGDVIYATDVGTGTDPGTFFGEGVFLQHDGQILQLARSASPAPGGGIFDVLLMGQTQLNDEGDGAFAFTLRPFDFTASPFGLNAGVYRYSHASGKVAAVVVPYVTAAPGGGTFAGAGFNTCLNNNGDLAFTGIVTTPTGLGFGVFIADKQGRITSVVSPGDAAPPIGSLHSFDSAGNSVWTDSRGDVAFVAHLAGEENGLSSLYLKNHLGTILSIAHAGDPAPGGGVFRSAYSPVMNESGDIVFQGDLSAPPNFQQVQGVYLYSGGKTVAVARPGDTMPGGREFVSAAVFPNALHINNAGEVVFGASIGVSETGMFVASHGALWSVAQTGTIIPGVGTVSQVITGGFFVPGTVANTEIVNNDRGQVLFAATLTDGRGVLLVATPHQ